MRKMIELTITGWVKCAAGCLGMGVGRVIWSVLWALGCCYRYLLISQWSGSTGPKAEIQLRKF